MTRNSFKLQDGPESFDDQWNRRQTIIIGDRRIEIADIAPKKEITRIPVLIGLGWLETPDILKQNILGLMEHGRRVICPNTPHGIKIQSDISKNRGEYPAVELMKMAALIYTLKSLNIDKVDVVSHSEGAIFSVMAAYLYPEKVRNMVLVNPAGMIGKDNLPRLMLGFSSDIIMHIIDEIHGIIKTADSEFRNHSLTALAHTRILSENPLQDIRSVFAIANSDIHSMISSLREKGVRVSVVLSTTDLVFPEKRIERIITNEKLDGTYIVEGSHNSYYLNPSEYNSTVNKALDAMEIM